jgi:pimeloyl-ACP methyl ester carboxylesterase
VAHDWGGAVSWLLANQCPQLLDKLVVLNAPHAATLLRELRHNPAQQAASAYMNFLIRPDAETLLAADDYRRLWRFFAVDGGDPPWLTAPLKAQYRAQWQQGLTGPCNYYRATPLRPARPGDPACESVVLPPATLNVTRPTLVIWGLEDTALPPALIDGLEGFVADLTVRRVPGATHWIVHEQPEALAGWIGDFLQRPSASP